MGAVSIGILNKSKKVTNQQVSDMTAAIQMQLSTHVAPAWNRTQPVVQFFSDPKKLPASFAPITIMDNPDAPDALGYHTEANGKPYGLIFVNPVLDNGGDIIFQGGQFPLTVSSVLSHEAIEYFCDPFVNSWCDGPELPEGTEYALEACDPVESNAYLVAVGKTQVLVSNFVFPSWFDTQAASGTRFDYMKLAKQPFTMTKWGYMVVRNGPGTETQVFGESYPEWRKKLKAHAVARAQKRHKQKRTK